MHTDNLEFVNLAAAQKAKCLTPPTPSTHSRRATSSLLPDRVPAIRTKHSQPVSVMAASPAEEQMKAPTRREKQRHGHRDRMVSREGEEVGKAEAEGEGEGARESKRERESGRGRGREREGEESQRARQSVGFPLNRCFRLDSRSVLFLKSTLT